MYTRLKKARKALGLSQLDVAKELDLSQPAYSKIEQGVTPLRERYVKLFCNSFNVSEDWLREEKGEMLRDESELKEFENIIYSLNTASKNSAYKILKELLELQQNTYTDPTPTTGEGE